MQLLQDPEHHLKALRIEGEDNQVLTNQKQPTQVRAVERPRADVCTRLVSRSDIKEMHVSTYSLVSSEKQACKTHLACAAVLLRPQHSSVTLTSAHA